MARNRALMSVVAGVAVAAAGWISPVSLTGPTALSSAAGAVPPDSVPEIPLPNLPAEVDPADRIDALPDVPADLPGEASVVVDPGVGWTQVPGTPVTVRQDPDAEPSAPPVATSGGWTIVPASAVAPAADEAPPVELTVDQPVDPAETALLIEVTAAPTGAPDAPTTSPAPTPTPTPGSTPSPTTEPAPTPAPSPAPSTPPTESAAPMQLRVSYADFAQVFGGAWGERLTVTAFPACYSLTPELEECATGVPVSAVNDPATQTLTFSTADAETIPSGPPPGVTGASWSTAKTSTAISTASAPPSGGTVYSVSGGAGNYGASGVNPAGSWQVSTGSGEFSYAYPFTLPAALGGGAPSLGLSYSSGSVDGMSLSENGQASMSGLGWDMSPGYITRSYTSCADDGLPERGDLCWKKDSAGLVDLLTIVLNGRSERLVELQGTPDEFRLLEDPNWRVTRHDGSDGPTNPDNNNEAFKVETPDGTTYWFGWGHGSGSVWTVPVFGNDVDEPCHDSTTAGSWCQQGWRWNLDKVTDANGNEIHYTYQAETNHYSRFAVSNTANRTQYDRGGWLDQISYGYARNATDLPRQLVDVTVADRCLGQLTNPAADCSGSNGPRAKPAQWPDVPGDLICDGNGTCDNYSPSFFSTKRYDQVVTRTVEGPEANPQRRTVDTFTLSFTMPDPDGAGPDQPDLWLNKILRSGSKASGGTTDLPTVNLNGVALQNRVKVGGDNRTLKKFRVDALRNETGGWVDVVYGHADGKECTPAYVTGLSRWQSTKECYPQKYAPPSGQADWEWFHKYVVTRVALGDETLGFRLGQAPPGQTWLGKLRVFDYEYHGAPAWRYVKSRNIPNSDESWNDWRGYAETVIRTRKIGENQGLTGDDLARRRVVVYRGMNGSKQDPDDTVGANVKIDTVEFSNSSDEPVDSVFKQGKVAEEEAAGPLGGWLSRTYRDYTSWSTGTADDGTTARAVQESLTRSYIKDGSGHKVRSTDVTFNTAGAGNRGILMGVPKAVLESGWGGSRHCTDTEWKHSSVDWIRAPYQVRVYDGTNDPTTGLSVNGPGDCVNGTLRSKTINHYDGDDYNAPQPITKGRLTATDVYTASGIWSRTKTSYDSYGRTIQVVDPRLEVTQTLYNDVPAYDQTTHDLITKVRIKRPGVTYVNGAGQATAWPVTTTEMEPRRGLPKVITDLNAKTTTLDYDGLGRLTDVYLPGNNGTGDPASLSYEYTVNPASGPSRVKTTSQRTDGQFDYAYAFMDGWGRAIETQAGKIETASDERMVSMTGYDEQGLVRYSSAGFPNSNQNNFTAPVNPNPDNLDDLAWTDYDALGRPLTVKSRYTGAANAVTTYSYTGNITRVEGAESTLGAVESATDPWGNTSWVKQLTSLTSTVVGHQVDYDYDAVGRLLSMKSNMTSPGTLSGSELATWSYVYDLAGRRTDSVDPDVGLTRSEYDANGNQTMVDTVGEAPIYTAYDDLNRPTTRNLGSPTGAELARWTYDSKTNGIGLAAETVSHTDGLGDFTTTINGYTTRGLPTGVTYDWPATLLGEAGHAPYTVTYNTYNKADQPTQITLGAAPGLAPVTVDTTYVKHGAYRKTTTTPSGGSLLTLGTAAYDSRDRPDHLTSIGASTLDRSFDFDDRTGALDILKATNNADPAAAGYKEHLTLDYGYDRLGNPTSVVGTVPSGSSTATASWCYAYEWANRLAKAQTLSACTAGNSTAASIASVTGAASYNLTYGYGADRLTKVTTGTAAESSSNTTVYNYATPGKHRTNTITSLGKSVATSTQHNASTPTPGTVEYEPSGSGRISKWRPPSGNGWGHTYDNQGRLQSTQTISATGAVVSAGVKVEHGYDDAGIRVARRTTDTTTTTTKTTTVVYVGDVEITATKVGTGSPTFISRRTVTTPGGTPLAQQESVSGNTAGKWTWLLTDGQDSVRLTLANTANATPTRQNYYPYGKPITTSTLPGEHGFLNKTHDPTGDVRLDHRTYNPALSILTTPDPLLDPANPQTLNPYAYATNNPVATSDPSGLMTISLDAGGGDRPTDPPPPPDTADEALAAAWLELGDEAADASELEVVLKAGNMCHDCSKEEKFTLLQLSHLYNPGVSAGSDGPGGLLGIPGVPRPPTKLTGYGGKPKFVPPALRRFVSSDGELLGRPSSGAANAGLHGFASADEVVSFASSLRGGLAKAGYDDVTPIMQGSAVTGRSFRTGQAFDAGRVSDFDVALASPTLLARAQSLGIGLRSGGIRTGPLRPADLHRLGLTDVASSLSASAGRPVNFMIYGSTQSAIARGPSVVLP